MSGFRFDPPNTKINYNFLLSNLKYKFNIKDKAAWYLDELYTLYLNKNFDSLNKKLQKFYEGNVLFLLEDDRKLALDCFRKLILIRNFIRKKLFYIHCDSLELSNETDLSYNTINLKDSDILSLVNCRKYKYCFRISEFMNLYRYALFNHDDEISEPVVVKNPYTGQNLSLHQHYIIYQDILEYYCKKKKCLPEFYVIFKNSYFDIKQFYCKYYVQLNYNAINNYVKDMNFRQWIFSISEYVSEQSFFCQKCFRKKANIRQIFSHSLQIFMLNDLDMFSYGDGLDNFIDICKKNSLYFPKKHSHMNRAVFTPNRRGRTLRVSGNDLSQLNLRPLPPLAPLNNLPNLQNNFQSNLENNEINDEQEENYEYMRGSHTLLGDDENVVVNISENAEVIVQHTLMDIIDKIAV